MRIQANPRALASYGLTLETLRTAIGSANVNGAKGQFDGTARSYTINANDQLATRRETMPTSSSPIATARRSG